jgi:hypothetical protein
MMRKHFRFKRLVLGLAFGLAIAAFSASAVQAKPTSGNGPLDPWAYGLIHRSTQANATPAAGYGPLDPWAYAVIHRSTQANARPAAGYGPLDPWAYAVIHRNSSGSVVPQDVRDHRLVAQLVQADRPTSQSAFNWGDAGIGASVSVAAVLLLLTALVLGRRQLQRINRSGLATS